MTAPTPHTTLRALIASKDFAGYDVQNASWCLDADKIEDMLYDRSYGSYSASDAHCRAFYDAEEVTQVSINSWLCSDQYVGLYVLCLNGTPFALSWQVGRKCDYDVAFLNDETCAFFREKWEEYRPAESRPITIIKDEVLDMPLAGPGQKPYSLDHSTGVENVCLDAWGVDKWLADLNTAGGLQSFEDVAVLKRVIESAQKEHDLNVARIAQIDAIPDERRKDNQDHLVQYRGELVQLKEEIERLMAPLHSRLDDLQNEVAQA